ncbi:PREDICTED: uncharacterized protein LOC106741318 [Dinoponera quadriceps]|uniref:Uncharacterized protein LOC106741318 n=1 Tax=Dinoponera quadriceps TaxID=609295 RepID=A0A6P3WRE0_DINQU|nr:PREDICTED: uncharacterized protein LOC106741318 [Dinoponera quadriceps]
MAVTRTTSVFRSDAGDGGSRRCHPSRMGVRVAVRQLRASSAVEGLSVTTKRAGPGKFLLIGALLAIQFVGAAAVPSKGGEIKVEFKVPKEAVVGSSVELMCEWRLLGGNVLYSVKWYKDEHEFFRYVPDSNPRILMFTQPGVNVEKKSNENSIKLRNLVLASSGQYKCEVSTEGPFFATTYQTANLTVISLPERGPEITGLSSHYAVGENVTANCTAWPSVPKANLRWTINGEPVPRENTVQHPPLAPFSTNGIPTSLGLRLEAEPRHFEGGGGLVKIKCTAEVGSRMYEAERRVLMAYVNNQRLSAGDHLHAAARSVRAGLLVPFTVFALVLLTT